MKVLIVNGYKSGPAGKHKFENFVKLVKQGFKRHKARLANNVEYVIRDTHNIDDFLHEAYSKYGTEESKKLFDSLDIVFMDGEANYLPWTQR